MERTTILHRRKGVIITQSNYPDSISTPIVNETVFVEYNDTYKYIYGFDWLSNTEAQKRKQLIKEKSLHFLSFTKSTNKSTIQTAEMLMDAQNDEELAAIWLAATAKELCELRIGNGLGRYTNILYLESTDFILAYYGWSDDTSDTNQITFDTQNDDICQIYSVNISDDELPF